MPSASSPSRIRTSCRCWSPGRSPHHWRCARWARCACWARCGPLEKLLDLFITAGFGEREALHAYRLYMGFLHGHVLNELQERVLAPEETDDLLRLGLHRLPLREFPRIRALAGELATYDGARELDEGLMVVLAGLRTAGQPIEYRP